MMYIKIIDIFMAHLSGGPIQTIDLCEKTIEYQKFVRNYCIVYVF